MAVLARARLGRAGEQPGGPGSRVAPDAARTRRARDAAEEGEARGRAQGAAGGARRAAAEAQRKLEREIAELAADRAKLNAALIERPPARAGDRRAHRGARAAPRRRCGASEAAIRRSLESRRGVIVEVLAALQRMGRRPPPAVLVRPEDMLEAVRASMLLGAVLPELRIETEALAADLAELVRLEGGDRAERDRARRRSWRRSSRSRQRLAALVDARQSRIGRGRAQRCGAERSKAAELARQARNSQRVDRPHGERNRVARRRRAAEEAAARPPRLRRARPASKFAALAFRDPARLAPKISFAEAEGLLPLPVSGDMVAGIRRVRTGRRHDARHFDRDAAESRRCLTCDGWVAFAGPFRSYGQLLIINAGGGYYLLLAGMDRINVEVGQFVLAGRAGGDDGRSDRRSSAASVGSETAQPVLYVEFRKDGGSIDPAHGGRNRRAKRFADDAQDIPSDSRCRPRRRRRDDR